MRPPALVALPLLSACAMDQGFNHEEERPPRSWRDTAPEETDEGAELPVAVCTVSPNPVTPPFESATWDGSGSYDPEGGEIVTWAWSLAEKPAGSVATMPQGDGARLAGFTPDLAGDYVGRLVVENDLGVASEPCEITLESIPAEDLWVEMYWSHDHDDMDLHLLAPGAGRADLTSNRDCYYANCVGGGPDWGTRGDPSDDPSLDLDDIPGVGPENINVLHPETTAPYTVYVHDFPESAYDGANEVTVNVYLDGSLAWTRRKAVSGENDYTPFCTVDWQAGDVTGLD